MRAVAVLAVICGCGFHVPAAGDDVLPADADGSVDAPADGEVAQAACATSPAYTTGPNGRRYSKIEARDRDGAFDACTAEGAHLAVIETAAEDSYVHTFANADVWIGYDDLKTEGTFRWVTGSLSTYEHFEGAEPNDSGVEDCTYIRADNGSWNDTNCGVPRPAICECEPGYTPPPTPVCRGMAGTTHDGRKYLIHEGTGSAKSWTAAKAACEAVGAHLPVFADREEEGPVNQEFSGENWMGLSDRTTEGSFVWIDGSTPTGSQSHWNITSPHNGDTTRNCVRIDVDWQDDPCTDPHEYACECEP